MIATATWGIAALLGLGAGIGYFFINQTTCGGDPRDAAQLRPIPHDPSPEVLRELVAVAQLQLNELRIRVPVTGDLDAVTTAAFARVRANAGLAVEAPLAQVIAAIDDLYRVRYALPVATRGEGY